MISICSPFERLYDLVISPLSRVSLKFFTYSLALNSLAFRFECSSVDDPVFEASIKDLLSVVVSGLFGTGAFPEVLLGLFHIFRSLF